MVTHSGCTGRGKSRLVKPKRECGHVVADAGVEGREWKVRVYNLRNFKETAFQMD
jgi:hypothetical protein